MRSHVTHLIDETASPDAAQLLSLLMRLLPAHRFTQDLCIVGKIPEGFSLSEGLRCQRIPLRLRSPALSLPALRRLLHETSPGVLHALGAQPSAMAGMLRRLGVDTPVVCTLVDPREAQVASRWWRSLDASSGDVEFLCSTQIAQRRLIEAGIPASSTAVTRGGVDFAELKEARSRTSKAAFNLAAKGPVLLMPAPPSRGGGHFIGVWAVAILRQLWPDVRMLIPGRSREATRIQRLIRTIYCPDSFIMTGDRFSLAELLSMSDALITPALEDVPTSSIAWAMAAGVPVIASAIPAVTEFIADRQNGFLVRAGEPHTLALRIRTAFESPDVMRQCVEVARGQAYDVFRSQLCVEQYASAFESRAAGQPAVTAVRDAAVVT